MISRVDLTANIIELEDKRKTIGPPALNQNSFREKKTLSPKKSGG